MAHLPSVGPEIIITAIEEHIFTKGAFQTAIQKRNLHRWFQTNIGEVLIIETEDPGGPALEMLLESGSDTAIEVCHIIGLQSGTIRRIHHEHTGLGILCPVGHRAAGEFDHLLHLGALYIASCDSFGIGIYIAAIDLIVEVAFGRIIIVDFLKEFGIKIGPFLESEILAVDTGIDIGRNKGCFDEECAGATHWICEITIAPPSGLHDDTGGEHLIDRGFCLSHPITAVGEGFATGVE